MDEHGLQRQKEYTALESIVNGTGAFACADRPRLVRPKSEPEMGSTNSKLSEHLLRASPMASIPPVGRDFCKASSTNGMPTIRITDIDQNERPTRNGITLKLDGTRRKRRGILGSMLSIVLYPALLPAAVVCAVSAEIANLLGAAPRDAPDVTSESVDTGYRCRRHSSASFSDLRVDQLEAFYRSGAGGGGRKQNTGCGSSAAGGPTGRRNSLRRNSLYGLTQHRLAMSSPKYIAPGDTRSGDVGFDHPMATRLLRASISLPSLPNLEQIDKRHSKLWRLILMPITVPLWFLDLGIFLIKTPIRLSKSVVERLLDEPPPPRRRQSIVRRPSKSILLLPGGTQSFH